MSQHVEVAGFESRDTGGHWYDGITDSIVDGARAIAGTIIKTIEPVASNALSTATAALAQLSYSGTTGNFTSAQQDIILSAKFQQITEQNPELYGSPLYQRRRLDTLSGFILCEHPVFSSGIATATEEAEIENFLSVGIFWE